jgi:hypothetical protein
MTENGNFPRDSKGDFPPELELAALGLLSKLAEERGLLLGKPFEVADAQALLTLLEVAASGRADEARSANLRKRAQTPRLVLWRRALVTVAQF